MNNEQGFRLGHAVCRVLFCPAPCRPGRVWARGEERNLCLLLGGGEPRWRQDSKVQQTQVCRALRGPGSAVELSRSVPGRVLVLTHTNLTLTCQRKP